MHTVWTKNLATEDQTQNFINSIQGAKIPFDRLIELLNEKRSEIERSMDGVKQYQSPNWAYETAHKNGMASAYKAVIDLVTIRDQ